MTAGPVRNSLFAIPDEFRNRMILCCGRILVQLLVLLSLCWVTVALADPVSAQSPSGSAIGLHSSYLKETGASLTISEATEAYDSGKFLAGDNPVLNFGIGSRPVWIHFDVENRTGNSLLRRLSIETSWLDKVDIYFRAGNKPVASYHLGDAQDFAQRPIDSRFFEVDHDFDHGISEVFIRIQTSDPMVVPIYLRTPGAAASFERWQGYSYGFVYGFLFALLAYNAILYIGLRSRRYIFYAVYLASFALLNIAYTGHGFEWLWPEQVGLQLWIIPYMMVLYGMSGLLFAATFLDTRNNFPRLNRIVAWICALFAVLLLGSFLFNFNAAGLDIAFLFVFVFSCLMIWLGVLAVRHGHKPARYFLFGAIAAMAGALMTDLSVAGLIPYNEFTYRAVEIGMLIDASVLALALAYQFRVGQQEKYQAELMARVDPLTGLNNRRAFYQIAKPVWSNALRNQRQISVIELDIDRFKQINDTHGHACGDEVLIAVASIMARSARDGDVLTRWGGEEFILLLPETDLDAAIALAERLRNLISAVKLQYHGKEIRFTASFGVAQRMPQCVSMDELISAADDRLYQSKRDGRNRVSYAPGA
jgi:diguanylate cyclase (GGDEF)-like protein